MSIPISPVTNSQSFGVWLTRTNQVLSIISSNTVTLDSSNTGSLSTGNGYVNGYFGVNTLNVTNNIGGGTINTPNTLFISTNTQILNGNTSFISFTPANISFYATNNITISSSNTFTVNSIALSISSNSLTVNSNTLILNGNTTFSNTLLLLSPVTVNSTFTVNSNTSLNNVTTNNITSSNLVSSYVNVTYDIIVGRNLYVNGNTVTTGSQSANGNIIPTFNNTYYVGNTSNRFIFFGANATFGNVIISSGGKLIFGDGTTMSTAVSPVPGSNTQVIFNTNGNLAANVSFTYNTSTNTLNISNTINSNNIISNTINLGYCSIVSNTFNTLGIGQQQMDSFPIATYRSASYQCQFSDVNNYHITNIMVVHDGTYVYTTEYGDIISNNTVASIDTVLSNGYVNILITPLTSSNVNVKFVRQTINI